MKDKITKELLRKLFYYHPDGYLINKVNRGRSAKAGNRTCKEYVKNYRQVRLFGFPYREHVLIWIWHYGQWPDVVDHIDRNIFNNKIENLRSITHKENIRHGYLSKQRGIFEAAPDRFLVRIVVNNKSKHICVCKTYEDAVIARKNAEKEYWGWVDHC